MATATPTHHSTYTDLLAAVIAEPADDTVRLVMADWFEEHGGDPARAEYIRAAIELARLDCCQCRVTHDEGCRWQELDCLTAVLKREHEARWRRGERCERCGGKGREPLAPPESIIGKWTLSCPTCHGSGWSGSLAEQREFAEVVADAMRGPTEAGVSQPYGFINPNRKWRHRAVWERGFPHTVHANLANCFDERGAVTAWAKACVAEWPVIALDVNNPDEFGMNIVSEGRGGNWYIPFSPLPLALSHLLRELGHDGNFDSPAAASDALARAACAVVRAGAMGSGSTPAAVQWRHGSRRTIPETPAIRR